MRAKGRRIKKLGRELGQITAVVQSLYTSDHAKKILDNYEAEHSAFRKDMAESRARLARSVEAIDVFRARMDAFERRLAALELPPPSTSKCSVEGCERQAKTTGLCSMHYQRMRRYGSTAGAPKTGPNGPTNGVYTREGG
jgi:antitoxin component HigA of HigAB toxin-antitoxin module